MEDWPLTGLERLHRHSFHLDRAAKTRSGVDYELDTVDGVAALWRLHYLLFLRAAAP